MPAIPNIQQDPQLPQYRFNRATGRYIDERGRFVSAQTIRTELDRVLDSITADMVDLSKRFRNGEIDGRTFQAEAMRLIKQSHLTSGAMAKGGFFNMSQQDFGRIGQITRREYGHFRDLLADITSGRQRLDGTLDNRMRLYGQAGRGTYHDFERIDRAAQGYNEERRILHARDHCTSQGDLEGCTELAKRNWQAIGSLPRIGNTPCRSNCRCTFAYRKETGETVGL